jgi:hypothetical protein
MENFLYKPDFSTIGSNRYFEYKERRVNALVRAEYYDNVSLWQRAFNLYYWMQMNKDHEFVLHWAKSDALLLQPHNSCAWTPQGRLRYDQRSIESTKAKINVEDCYDEYFGSAFETWMEWGTSPEVVKRAPVTDLLTDSIMRSTVMNIKAVLTAGGLFQDPKFLPGVATNIRQAFLKSAFVRRGWMQAAREMAADKPAKYAHLDNNLIQNADISNDGKKFTGDPLALFDARLQAAPEKLYDAVTLGGQVGFGAVQNVPVWLVSTSVLRSIHLKKQEQDAALATNQVRITVDTLQVDMGQANAAPLTVYRIDGIPAIPVTEVNVFAEYLTGTPHFDYLMLTGTVQLGGSFAQIPSAPEDVAIRVQQSTDNRDLGKTTYLAHMRLAAAFNDTDYISGGYRFNEPA